jgi:hypothetical protein
MRNLKYAVFASIIGLFCSYGACEGVTVAETQIGPFDLTIPQKNEGEFVAVYGKGVEVVEQYGDMVMGSKHIYYSKGQNLWIEIRFSHIRDKSMQRIMEAVLVTKKKLCNQEYTPKTPFPKLSTSKGFELGTSLQVLRDEYGKPTASINIGRDKQYSSLVDYMDLTRGVVLKYVPTERREINFAEFYFNEEVLHSMVISIED